MADRVSADLKSLKKYSNMALRIMSLKVRGSNVSYKMFEIADCCQKTNTYKLKVGLL